MFWYITSLFYATVLLITPASAQSSAKVMQPWTAPAIVTPEPARPSSEAKPQALVPNAPAPSQPAAIKPRHLPPVDLIDKLGLTVWADIMTLSVFIVLYALMSVGSVLILLGKLFGTSAQMLDKAKVADERRLELTKRLIKANGQVARLERQISLTKKG